MKLKPASSLSIVVCYLKILSCPFLSYLFMFFYLLDAASKHALHGYFDSLRVEVESRGVYVTMVCPGYVQTRLSVNALHGDGSHHGGMLDYTGFYIHVCF